MRTSVVALRSFEKTDSRTRDDIALMLARERKKEGGGKEREEGREGKKKGITLFRRTKSKFFIEDHHAIHDLASPNYRLPVASLCSLFRKLLPSTRSLNRR